MKPFPELRRRPWGLLELALAGLLIAWRAAAPTWHPLPLDILFYLALYWIFLVLVPDERKAAGATIVLTLLLFGLYLKGVAPHALAAADLLP